MPTFSVYAILCPTHGHVVYVGITSQAPVKRWRVHLHAARHGCPYPIYRWIRAQWTAGFKPVMTVLFETDDPQEEFRLIRQHRETGLLLNVTEGGDARTGGWKRGPMSEEHKAKIRAAILGRNHTEEAKARMRKPKSAEHAAKLASINLGRKYGPPSQETRKKQAASLAGNVPWAAFTEAQVREIRALYALGMHSQGQMAETHGVPKVTIAKLIRGATYAWVDGALSSEQIRQIAQSQRAKSLPDVTKKKMSETHKRIWAERARSRTG